MSPLDLKHYQTLIITNHASLLNIILIPSETFDVEKAETLHHQLGQYIDLFFLGDDQIHYCQSMNDLLIKLMELTSLKLSFPEEDEEDSGDDMCDNCFSSGLSCNQTCDCGKTLCDKCAEVNNDQCSACAFRELECHCQNCDWHGPIKETNDIKRYTERVADGEPVPCGECPKCGALCQENEKE